MQPRCDREGHGPGRKLPYFSEGSSSAAGWRRARLSRLDGRIEAWRVTSSGQWLRIGAFGPAVVLTVGYGTLGVFLGALQGAGDGASLAKGPGAADQTPCGSEPQLAQPRASSSAS